MDSAYIKNVVGFDYSELTQDDIRGVREVYRLLSREHPGFGLISESRGEQTDAIGSNEALGSYPVFWECASEGG